MEKIQTMSLIHCYAIMTDGVKSSITDPIKGVEFTYSFMAKRSKKGSDNIEMKLWVFLKDWQGYNYQHFGIHMGHYKDWQETIIKRVEKCLLSHGVDKLQVMRMMRDFEPSKDKLIKWDSNLNDVRNIH